MTKPLPERPNLRQYKKQAKELVKAHNAGDPEALARVCAWHPRRSEGNEAAPIQLSDAQLVTAREHGFPSWPRFKQQVEGLASGELLPLGKGWIEVDSLAGQMLAALRSGAPQALAEARRLDPDFDVEAAPVDVTLDDARHLAARRHGFDTWEEIRTQIERLKFDDPGEPNHAARLAILSRDTAVLADLIRRHPETVRARGENDNTLLHLASGAGELKAVRMLLAAGADVNARNHYGWTPLHAAAYAEPSEPRPGPQKRCAAVIPVLMDAGASPEIECDADGSTPLALALFWGHTVLGDLLAPHGVHPPNLRMAAGLGRQDLIDAQFTKSGELRASARTGRAFHRPHDGWHAWEPTDEDRELLDEALIWACGNGRYDAVDPLIARGAHVNGVVYQGTALHRVAATGYLDLAAHLIDVGADVNLPGDFGAQSGIRALHMAVWAGNGDMVRLLVDRGADVSATDREHHSTAAEWADFFERGDLAAWLRGRA